MEVLLPGRHPDRSGRAPLQAGAAGCWAALQNRGKEFGILGREGESRKGKETEKPVSRERLGSWGGGGKAEFSNKRDHCMILVHVLGSAQGVPPWVGGESARSRVFTCVDLLGVEMEQWVTWGERERVPGSAPGVMGSLGGCGIP